MSYYSHHPPMYLQVYFGTQSARMFLIGPLMNQTCIVGMSWLLKRDALEKVGGSWYILTLLCTVQRVIFESQYFADFNEAVEMYVQYTNPLKKLLSSKIFYTKFYKNLSLEKLPPIRYIRVTAFSRYLQCILMMDIPYVASQNLYIYCHFFLASFTGLNSFFCSLSGRFFVMQVNKVNKNKE